MATLAVQLDYQGKHATNSARKWAIRRGLPRYWRGRTWLVNQADVDAALKGATYGAVDVGLHRDRATGAVGDGVADRADVLGTGEVRR